METATISLEVDADSARAFDSAPAAERQKMQLLLGLRLRELTSRPVRSLPIIMDEIGREAETRGLTPELLESLLRDE